MKTKKRATASPGNARPSKPVEPTTPQSRSDSLPLPEPRFQGRIGNTYADSEADVMALPAPPAGAPNVLVVLLDDVGFGQTSTFGGPVSTPTLQRLADARRAALGPQPPFGPHRLHHGDGDGLPGLRRAVAEGSRVHRGDPQGSSLRDGRVR